jgi:hypothetical protein
MDTASQGMQQGMQQATVGMQQGILEPSIHMDTDNVTMTYCILLYSQSGPAAGYDNAGGDSWDAARYSKTLQQGMTMQMTMQEATVLEPSVQRIQQGILEPSIHNLIMS